MYRAIAIVLQSQKNEVRTSIATQPKKLKSPKTDLIGLRNEPPRTPRTPRSRREFLRLFLSVERSLDFQILATD